MVQNSKGRASALAHSAAAHSKYTENLPVRPFSQPQKYIFPVKAEEQFDRKALLAALNAYVAQKAAANNQDGSFSLSRTKGASSYNSMPRPPQMDHLDGTLPKERTGDFEMRPSFLQRPAPALLVPGSAQDDPRTPLTTVDGKGSIYFSSLLISHLMS